MKYSDEELAEASVLLAHTKEADGLSKAMEASLLSKGSELAASLRHSTTRGAAMELGDTLMQQSEHASLASSRRSRVVPWLGWCAAAAAAALLVYGMRRPAEHAAATALPIRQNPIELKDSGGAVVASLDVQADTPAALLQVKRLPAAPSQRYQLWIAKEDGVARPVGFFGCEKECSEMTWRVQGSPRPGELRHAWITRSATEARVLGVGTEIVAEAGSDDRR